MTAGKGSTDSLSKNKRMTQRKKPIVPVSGRKMNDLETHSLPAWSKDDCSKRGTFR